MILKLKEAFAQAKEKIHKENTKKYRKKYYLTVLKPEQERLRTSICIESQPE